MEIKLTLNRLFCCLVFLMNIISIPSFAQKFQVSGIVVDSTSGEVLPFAHIRMQARGVVTQTNAYGYYSITASKGSNSFEVSYLGYKTSKFTVNVVGNTTADFRLRPSATDLDAVNVSSKSDAVSYDALTGKASLSVGQVKNMPTLGGEADIMQALQYLPGVRTAVEGTTGLSVRGGSFDQTLVLLDEAPVYNPSHALGFYSAFNPDAIKSIDIYRGLMPAQFGGRLSSVLDLKMREGNNQKFAVSGAVGLIASRIVAEGPIQKDRSSFIVSGRYSYAGMLANTAGNLGKSLHLGGLGGFQEGNDIRFYDLNAKLNWKSANSKNQFFLSGYLGGDWFEYYLFQKGTFTKWRNATGSLRWNHIFSDKLFSQTTLYYSRYHYNYNLLNDRRDFDWSAGLTEVGFKNELDYFVTDRSFIKGGINVTHTTYEPGSILPKSETSLTVPFSLASKKTFQASAFLGVTSQVGQKISVYLGGRLSTFGLLGPGLFYKYVPEQSKPVDSTWYASNKVVKSFAAFEPRLSGKYQIDSAKSISIAFARTVQYVHLLGNTSVGLPTDVWLPSSPNVKPQAARIASISYSQNLPGVSFELEVYYKAFNRVIDFIDNANLFVNQYVESQVRAGKGRAMGAEASVTKKTGKLTGWITYTLAKTDRTIEGINHDRRYPTRFDRRHSFSLVSAYQLKKHIMLSLDFQYNSGGAASLPTAVYQFQGSTFNYYPDRNGFRLPSFHRMDVQASFSKKKRWGERKWIVGLYNAYNRHNLFSVDVVAADYNWFQKSNISAVSLYGIVPSISYNFSF